MVASEKPEWGELLEAKCSYWFLCSYPAQGIRSCI